MLNKNYKITKNENINSNNEWWGWAGIGAGVYTGLVIAAIAC